LDDPTKANPITIDETHLPALKNKDYLSTGLIDYLMQRSINIRNDHQTIFASSLSLSVMERLLQKDWNDIDCNVTHYKMF
jgi:hypothetical protein